MIYLDFRSLMPAKINNKWGLIDSLGKEITPFKYESIFFEDHKHIVFIEKGNMA